MMSTVVSITDFFDTKDSLFKKSLECRTEMANS